MTTWVTFETIDESNNFDVFYIDRLGVHQYRQDERTRFEVARTPKPDGSFTWSVIDLEDEEGRPQFKTGDMETIVAWVAGRVLYGA